MICDSVEAASQCDFILTSSKSFLKRTTQRSSIDQVNVTTESFAIFKLYKVRQFFCFTDILLTEFCSHPKLVHEMTFPPQIKIYCNAYEIISIK